MNEIGHFLTFMIGLLGSIHCIGMCGGFPMTLSTRAATHGRNIAHQVAYNAGRVMTYGFLGAVMGYLGYELTGWRGFTGVQSFLAIVSGSFMILIALQILGATGRMRLPGFLTEGLAFFGGLLKTDRLGGGIGSAFYLGLFNGFLPCGLIYAAAARAAGAGSILSGWFVMTIFGLGTIPSLLFLGVSGRMISARIKEKTFMLAGGVVFLLGVITVIRGWLSHHA